MPDFEARFTSGVVLAVWTDPPEPEGPTTGPGGAPSRLNPLPGLPPTYWRAVIGATIAVEASVDGTAGPVDLALGGRLFTTHLAEVPDWPPPLVTSPLNHSSVASFVPRSMGHHLIVMRRNAGGAVALPVYVEFSTF